MTTKTMKHLALTVSLLALVAAGIYFWDDGHPHNVPTVINHGESTVTIEDRTVTITFGPIDLPFSHTKQNMPKTLIEFLEDMYLVGYKSAIFTKDGAPLPHNYLHHLVVMNNNKKSLQCPKQNSYVAISGMEKTRVRFPAGYGVKLGKGDKLGTDLMFNHMVPPTKDVMVSFTLEMASEGATVQPMEVFWVGVNDYLSKCGHGKKAHREFRRGTLINPGLDVRSASLKFRMDGCVKFVLPHGHNQLLLITLDNKTTGQTLIRTVPKVTLDGAMIAFEPHQVYKDPVGFPVNTKDKYGMTMVHHRSLNDSRDYFGMGYYLMHMTLGPCQPGGFSSVR